MQTNVTPSGLMTVGAHFDDDDDDADDDDNDDANDF